MRSWLGEGSQGATVAQCMRGSAGYGSGDGVINRYCDDAVTFADLDG
ncbi:Uncharacterised protein [Salmonella enterica subsp. enterica]|uniref:Uncharacterized protein n=1 Tax=Salmonella enterica I TaxID=59201 RepID=A0A447MT84_SALET|nr:Uncharacterised protein [Salmonella enterica subsp. enterica]